MKKLYHIKEGMALLKTAFLPRPLLELSLEKEPHKIKIGKLPFLFSIFLLNGLYNIRVQDAYFSSFEPTYQSRT